MTFSTLWMLTKSGHFWTCKHSLWMTPKAIELFAKISSFSEESICQCVKLRSKKNPTSAGRKFKIVQQGKTRLISCFCSTPFPFFNFSCRFLNSKYQLFFPTWILIITIYLLDLRNNNTAISNHNKEKYHTYYIVNT